MRRVAGWGVIAAAGVMSMRRRPPGPPIARARRIVIVRVDLLGDVLFTLGLAEGIRCRYPDARIVMITLPYTAPLARLCPAVDEVIEVDTNRIRSPRGLLDPSTWSTYLLTLRRIRAEHFDLAVSVYGRMGSLVARLTGAQRVVGYEDEAYPYLLTDALPGGRHDERQHEVEYVRRLGQALGLADFPAWPRLDLPAASRETVDQSLRRHGITPGDRVIALHAGSVNGAAKRWPQKYWADLAIRLRGELGAVPVLIGAASDSTIGRAVVREAGDWLVSLTGETDVPQLAALLERACLVISGDSGPLHLAVALGRPLVALYGPTDPVIYGPFAPRAAVRLHRRALPCSPCYTLAATAECPLGDPICMRLITPTEVMESVRGLLAQPAR